MPPNTKTKESFLPPLWILTALAVCLGIWLVHVLYEIVILLVVGYTIAYVIHPILTSLERRGISRTSGFFVVALLLVALMFVLVLTALPVFVREYRQLLDQWPVYLSTAQERFGNVVDDVRAALPPALAPEGDWLSDLPALGGAALRRGVTALWLALAHGVSFTMALLNIFLLPFIVFYIAVDFREIHSQILLLFAPKQRKKVSSIASEIDVHVSAFVRGQLIVCSILAVLYAVMLGLLGVDLWVVLAAVSGFGNMIPYFGFLSGIILSSIMALVTFGDLAHLLWVWAIFGFVQFLEGMFITPRIVGEKVGLSPLAVIISIFAGGKIFGILGILLAIPGAAAMKVLGRHTRAWALGRAGLS